MPLLIDGRLNHCQNAPTVGFELTLFLAHLMLVLCRGELPSDKCAQAVAEYARLWLQHLGEVMEGAAKQKLAVDASNVADSTRVDSSG
jgi:hypothetical protein